MDDPEFVYRANVVRLDPSPAEAVVLRDVARRVSAFWNVANYECRQRFFKGERVPSCTKLWNLTKAHSTYKALPSDVAQEVLKKLSESWKSHFELRRKWKRGEIPDKPGLPRYRKDRKTKEYREDFIPIKTDRSYAVESRTVTVTLPRDLRGDDVAVENRIAVSYRGLRRYTGKKGRAEISFDAGRGRWYFRWSVKSEAQPNRTWTRAAGIDLGVRVLASVSVEGEAVATHFSGRETLKDWDYWGRQIARHQRELAHRKRRSSKRLRRLHRKRRQRLVHAWEALAAQVASEMKRKKVGVVYIGHPKNIRRDRRYQGPWNGRIHNFWGFALSSRILKKHLNRARIQVLLVDERGTSSRCPGCPSSEVTRRPRHWLRCRECGLEIHSDQAGSRNMINKYRPDTSWDGLEASPRTEAHIWNQHRWVDSENQRSAHALPRAA